MGNTPSVSSAVPSPPLPANHPSTSPDSQDTCPVDHRAREAWQKAASAALPPNHPPPSSTSTSAQECPVDHKSRQAWLDIGRNTAQAQAQASSSADPGPASATPLRPRMTNSRLSTHREVSNIPRAFADSTQLTPADRPSSAAPRASHASLQSAPAGRSAQPLSGNAQTADPHTSADGTWIYPSEEMFFNAMRRKKFSPRETDMPSVIPIHNAVNERTWKEILWWEKPYNAPTGSSASGGARGLCGGPKLVSFAGDSTKLSPRARWNAMLGYEKPFDRHDWVVDRCGTKVEYVIDYYQGKAPAGEQGQNGPSFYLDVRPKLNSWEGAKMRMLRAVGWASS